MIQLIGGVFMVSKKCTPILEQMDSDVKEEICQKSSIRSLVGCLATKKRKVDGLGYGEAMKQAWKEAKEFCADYR